MFLRSACIAAFLLASIAIKASAEPVATAAEARHIADGIMGSVGAGNYDGALRQLKENAVVPGAEVDVVSAQFTSQLPNILRRYGSSIGYEFLGEEKVGVSLIRLSYIAKHEKSAMRWVFIFYRGDKGWSLSDFRYDGNLHALFAGQG